LLPLNEATEPIVTEGKESRQSTLQASNDLVLSLGREGGVEVWVDGILTEELEDHQTDLDQERKRRENRRCGGKVFFRRDRNLRLGEIVLSPMLHHLFDERWPLLRKISLGDFYDDLGESGSECE
jgi:hypothetical protein